jgi:hypothetical protein
MKNYMENCDDSKIMESVSHEKLYDDKIMKRDSNPYHRNNHFPLKHEIVLEMCTSYIILGTLKALNLRCFH